jgi:hypothetical protein
MHER